MSAVLKESPESAEDAAHRLTAGARRKGFVPAGLHCYADASGQPLFHRIRLKHPDGRKWIRPMHRASDGYSIGEPPAPAEGKPLYRLPDLAADPAAVVWIVEGESCADALAGLGLTATTSGAADSAAAADWTPLRGRHCVVWPDLDAAGARYADAIAEFLARIGCTVEKVDVGALGLPEKGDCVDWLAMHPEATAEHVVALARVGGKEGDAVAQALSASVVDPGALFEPAILAELRRIRAQEPARYARVRAQAKEARVPVGELDRLTAAAGEAAGDADVFEDIEPWAEPVDGAALLGDLNAQFRRFVIADEPTIRAAVLWALHTHLADACTVSPIANVTAPEKRCGKTILLNVLGRVVRRPLIASNIATAALFRSIELWAPTLLIDEVDSFLRENEEARGILNAGLYRDGAFVIRCVGDDHTPTRFSVWAPKALCGIGKLADTLADRSIPLRLRRKTPGERVENLRHSDPHQWNVLAARIVRWTDDNRTRIAAARPAPVEGMHDRANDCWEPLLAIADAAGGDWPKLARHAAMALHGVEGDAPSVNAELLADIREAYGTRDRLATAELLAALVADEESPWPTWNRGRPMSARQLSARLAEFGIRPGTIRIGAQTAKGYLRSAFTDAFDRYLSGEGEVSSVTPSQANAGAGLRAFPSVTTDHRVTDESTPKARRGAGCDAVTDRTPLPAGMEGTEAIDL